MKKNLVIILIMFLFACEKQSHFEKNLTDDPKNTYWVRKAKDSSGNFNYIGIQMIFHKDKTDDVFYSKNENIKGEYGNIYIEGIQKKSKDWDYYIENNLFFMFPDVYSITKYSKDTIFMHLQIGKQEQFIMVRKHIKK